MVDISAELVLATRRGMTPLEASNVVAVAMGLRAQPNGWKSLELSQIQFLRWLAERRVRLRDATP